MYYNDRESVSDLQQSAELFFDKKRGSQYLRASIFNNPPRFASLTAVSKLYP